MTDLTLPLTGQCRCGGVRLRVTAAPIITMACHCTGCQRMTASAYSLSAAIPTDGFAVTEGAPVIGGLHGAAQHFHCPNCLSWLYTRSDALPWFVNLRPTMLDDTAWFAPFIETWTVERLPWATTPAIHSFDRFPPPEAYERLAREFAARPRG